MTTIQQMTRPIPGVWQFSDYGQRPVEGIALYQYSRGWWECEQHGQWHPTAMTARPCGHIMAATGGKP